jgi:hypothetical protein
MSPATDAEVIGFLMAKWIDDETGKPTLCGNAEGGSVLFDVDYEYHHGPVPEPVLARLRELGYEL